MVELPKSGKAIVVTDIHGNLFILNKLMEKAIKELSFGNYFICCGDFLHSMGDKDKSIEIIEMLIYLKSRYPRNFIVLLGNHEWAHISGKPVYKGETNLKDGFIALLKEKYDTKWNEKYNQYKSFFKTLKIAARTGKTLISHAAPDKLVTEEDFSNYNPESVRGRKTRSTACSGHGPGNWAIRSTHSRLMIWATLTCSCRRCDASCQ